MRRLLITLLVLLPAEAWAVHPRAILDAGVALGTSGGRELVVP